MSELVTKSLAQEQQDQKMEAHTSMKRIAGLTVGATTIAVLAVLGVIAIYAQGQNNDKYSLKSPSGIAFSDFRGYEDWADRDNMPFGRPGHGEFGTYFIGYSRSPRTIEQMLENMFIGRPLGNYDRLLDFSRAVTGNLFFVPSATFLDDVTEDQTQPEAAESPAVQAVAETSSSISPVRDSSLGIGSLKGDKGHE